MILRAKIIMIFSLMILRLQFHGNQRPLHQAEKIIMSYMNESWGPKLDVWLSCEKPHYLETKAPLGHIVKQVV